MKKTKLKCVLDYAVVNGIFNNEIYYYSGGGWDSRTLATCINCGELFVYDEQELVFKKMTLKERTNGLKCPKCNLTLDKTIEKYPDTFRTKNDAIGHQKTPGSLSTSEDKMKTIEVWDLFS
jgi:DNA-directed RNA polymerase subunit RPC12/RpoP